MVALDEERTEEREHASEALPVPALPSPPPRALGGRSPAAPVRGGRTLREASAPPRPVQQQQRQQHAEGDALSGRGTAAAADLGAQAELGHGGDRAAHAAEQSHRTRVGAGDKGAGAGAGAGAGVVAGKGADAGAACSPYTAAPPAPAAAFVSSTSSRKVKETFSRDVRRHFKSLRARGVAPNDAAALALKLASGTSEAPLDLPHFLRSVEEARTSEECLRQLVERVRDVFGSADVLNSSFLVPSAPAAKARAEQAGAPGGGAPGEEAEGANGGGVAAQALPAGGGGPADVDDAPPARGASLGIDFDAVKSAYDAVTSLASAELVAALMSASGRLLDVLGAACSWAAAGSNPTMLRQLLIVLENPLLSEPGHHDVLAKLCRVVAALPSASQAALVDTLATYSPERLSNAVSVVQHFITVRLYDTQAIDEPVETATYLLAYLYAANGALPAGTALRTSEFYNDAVNSEDFNIKEDYRRWKQPQRYAFSFCKCAPWIYDPGSKSRLLHLESTVKMSHEFEDAVLRSIFITATCPYLVLRVRRSSLVQDTLHQIQRSPEDLKKPLKVHFVGEEGVDEGGVQKEFFSTILREIFDPVYGMFRQDEDTRLCWFNALTLELDMEYELIGILLGLAIYNGHILDCRFPMVVYRKLLGYMPTFEDLREVDPALASGLQKLLDFDGDVQEAFDLNFQLSYDVFGETREVDLLPDGANTPVTNDSRGQYVWLYTRHTLETSIERQFAAFARGFYRMCGGPVMQLFQPEELEQLVCGSPELDFVALEMATVYDDGYDSESPTVRDFWEVVHALPAEEKQGLLRFVTGSDRVPIKGLGSLPFVISRNGPDTDRLPTAHTCFNHLLLPQYESAEKLGRLLRLAIGNAVGFGLV